VEKMTKSNLHLVVISIFIILTSRQALALAQDRPSLFFREDWKQIPAAKPVTQDHVDNPELIVSLHGPGKAGIKKSHHDHPADDPFYIWSGEAEGNWGISLRHKNSWVDLTGMAKIRWRSKQAGFRQLRIILKLASGEWLVSDQYDDQSGDWRIREFNVSDLHWRQLDINKMIEGRWAQDPDLSRVDEIGWTDLMAGGGSDACSRVDWIEVYGKRLPRGKL
jgi:hypothetical protein